MNNQIKTLIIPAIFVITTGIPTAFGYYHPFLSILIILGIALGTFNILKYNKEHDKAISTIFLITMIFISYIGTH